MKQLCSVAMHTNSTSLHAKYQVGSTMVAEIM